MQKELYNDNTDNVNELANEGEVLPSGKLYHDAVEFLQAFAPKGGWNLFTLDPETGKPGPFARFDLNTLKEADTWIRKYDGQYNIYYHVNFLPKNFKEARARERDVLQVRALHLDIDIPKDIDWTNSNEAEVNKQAIFYKLNRYKLAPSFIIYTGGGYQALWLLEEPYTLTGDNFLEVKQRTKKIQDHLGGDPCESLEHVMRLPGTMNVLNAGKRARGRKPMRAHVVECHPERTYALEDFERLPDPPKRPKFKAPELNEIAFDSMRHIVKEALRSISPDCGYHEWRGVIWAASDAFGEDERIFEDLDEWSEGSTDKYNWNELRRLYFSSRDYVENPVTLGTVFEFARQSSGYANALQFVLNNFSRDPQSILEQDQLKYAAVLKRFYKPEYERFLAIIKPKITFLTEYKSLPGKFLNPKNRL